ncbi:GGDEF domain-containing protein [Glaciecola sp. XM2]|uniref:GGDEF domain-containing protein n=1 Tax=Glaciecola sp. XM2 TaxID=1914931 RepID=UPI001BDE60E6|nr:GGDEF domain-containing protein [Glaciecola sp. XM2]MBT1451217.1 GGDEF domain-containing protein [Glaciecola sp. XM2]
MKQYLALLVTAIVLMLWCFFVEAQTTLFDERFKNEYAKMRQQPQAYAETSGRSSPDADFYTQAQNDYILAEAYIKLERDNASILQLQEGISRLAAASPQSAQLQAEFFERLSDLYLRSNDLSTARIAITDAINNTLRGSQTSVLLNRLQKRAFIDQRAGASISALQDLQLALQLAISEDDTSSAVIISIKIAQLHQQRNEHAIALSYAQRAITTAESFNESTTMLEALMVSMPSLIASQRWDEARSQLAAINEMLSDQQNTLYSARSLQFAADIAFQNNALEETIELSLRALALLEADQQTYMAQSHLLLSRAHTELNDMDSAIEHLVAAFNATQIDNSAFDLVQSIHLHRAELLGRLDQFEEAFRVTKDVLAARDVNKPIDEIKRMLDIHTNFQLQLQQQENAELKQKNQVQTSEIEDKQMLNRLYFLVISLLFCMTCLLLLLFIRSRNHRLKLEYIAHTDALTELYSRRRIMEILEHQQDMFNRNLSPYCVAIIDLDFFKKINDTYGHQCGDDVLKDAAQLARDTFRKTDSLGRIGGEEFLFIFPDTPIEQGIRLLEKYRKRVHKIASKRNMQQSTTTSIGLVQAIEKEDISNIISRADRALYKAKNNGRDQIISDMNLALDKAK